MLLFDQIRIPLKSPVNTLCWWDDYLIDWTTNRVIRLDGDDGGMKRHLGFSFDAAVQSPSGRFAAVYKRLGTKAALLDRGKFIREINRSFNLAEDYEYPIVFAMLADGREVLIHCPDEYDRLEIEEVATGTRLTSSTMRVSMGMFHSRLSVSPDSKKLCSAGWFWHPFSSILAFSIQDAIVNPALLDQTGVPAAVRGADVDDATFIDSDRVLVYSSDDSPQPKTSQSFRPGTLAMVNLTTDSLEFVTEVPETIGRMMWLGENRVLGLHESPRAIDVMSGEVVHRWSDLRTGKQHASFICEGDSIVPLALDQMRKRIAIASESELTVIQFR